ncbi:MAG: hypothetical protein O7D91_21340 [Planctomycetota bacterium]|nr:hypothetical protein [Planctomycetota bacterium]
MPHITVKVDSSQVARLIDIADQLRRMSDDLKVAIRNSTQVVVTRADDDGKWMEDAAAKFAGQGAVDYCRDDPDAIQDAP